MSAVTALRCVRCGAVRPLALAVDGCTVCTDARANLRVEYADDARTRWRRCGGGPGLWRFAPMLPQAAEPVTLGEGGTPLVSVRRLGATLGLDHLAIKDESRNPTWSYKDRVSTVAVSAARQLGARVVATASSGNAGASLAAYAAKAGLPCVVFTFVGTAGPMLSQIMKYGAMVVPLARKQDRWPLLSQCVRRFGWFATSPYSAPVVGSHPLGIEGYKTLAYEICADLGGEVPDWVVMPVCYGDAFAGAWYGFQELHAAGAIDRLPRMAAAEVFGSLGAALESGEDRVPDMPANWDPLAVSVGATQSAFQALNVLRQSGGLAVRVDNDGLIDAQDELARSEGLFTELTGAMPVVAVRKLRQSGHIKASDRVVAVATAGGLKDLDKSVAAGASPAPVEGTLDAVLRFLDERFQWQPAR